MAPPAVTPFGDNRRMPAAHRTPAPRTTRDLSERALLLRLGKGPVSGDRLAGELGLTRAAIWKRIDALRQAGVEVEARAGVGYALARPADLLDARRIRADIPAHIPDELVELRVDWQVDSTNSQLLSRAAPARGARVLLAERQTGGRGRLGRSWASPLACNLYLSLDRQFSGGLARLAGLSLVAGIASAEALREATGLDIRLKWPNDLWLDGRKLGGLLVEGGGEHGGPVRAVVGLGLNVRMPPAFGARIDQPWIDLSQVMTPPSRNHLASQLIAAWVQALDAFDRDGLASFLPRWAALDALVGQPVCLLDGRGQHEAVVLGIAADGGLRVQQEGRERIMYSGEVSVRPRA